LFFGFGWTQGLMLARQVLVPHPHCFLL
jgi:hypothetical protein